MAETPQGRIPANIGFDDVVAWVRKASTIRFTADDKGTGVLLLRALEEMAAHVREWEKVYAETGEQRATTTHIGGPCQWCITYDFITGLLAEYQR